MLSGCPVAAFQIVTVPSPRAFVVESFFPVGAEHHCHCAPCGLSSIRSRLPSESQMIAVFRSLPRRTSFLVGAERDTGHTVGVSATRSGSPRGRDVPDFAGMIESLPEGKSLAVGGEHGHTDWLCMPLRGVQAHFQVAAFHTLTVLSELRRGDPLPSGLELQPRRRRCVLSEAIPGGRSRQTRSAVPSTLAEAVDQPLELKQLLTPSVCPKSMTRSSSISGRSDWIQIRGGP